jgi:hypothetical protein
LKYWAKLVATLRGARNLGWQFSQDFVLGYYHRLPTGAGELPFISGRDSPPTVGLVRMTFQLTLLGMTSHLTLVRMTSQLTSMLMKGTFGVRGIPPLRLRSGQALGAIKLRRRWGTQGLRVVELWVHQLRDSLRTVGPVRMTSHFALVSFYSNWRTAITNCDLSIK